jgi:hypothetical protein
MCWLEGLLPLKVTIIGLKKSKSSQFQEKHQKFV